MIRLSISNIRKFPSPTFLFPNVKVLNMEPPQRKFERRKSFLFGTALLLILGFFALILLFVAFTYVLPQFMGKCVAVVNVDMPISVEGQPSSLFSTGYAGSEGMADSIKSLNKRDDVAAALFVFNSPGGSVVASREIYSAVKALNKPKVSFFREMAASGAYYIAAGTDYIVSDPDALTGSIGVIATFTDMSGLLEKIGVNVTSVTSGIHKDIGSSTRPMKEEELTIFRALIQEVFDEFKGVVVENRKSKLNAALFEEVLDGRILTGRQAKAVGLVDTTGSKDDALKKAADLGGISYESVDDIRVCEVQTTPQDAGLLGANAIFRFFSNPPNSYSLNFR